MITMREKTQAIINAIKYESNQLDTNLIDLIGVDDTQVTNDMQVVNVIKGIILDRVPMYIQVYDNRIGITFGFIDINNFSTTEKANVFEAIVRLQTKTSHFVCTIDHDKILIHTTVNDSEYISYEIIDQTKLSILMLEKIEDIITYIGILLSATKPSTSIKQLIEEKNFH